MGDLTPLDKAVLQAIDDAATGRHERPDPCERSGQGVIGDAQANVEIRVLVAPTPCERGGQLQPAALRAALHRPD